MKVTIKTWKAAALSAALIAVSLLSSGCVTVVVPGVFEN
jgi:hypothetical protein